MGHPLLRVRFGYQFEYPDDGHDSERRTRTFAFMNSSECHRDVENPADHANTLRQPSFGFMTAIADDQGHPVLTAGTPVEHIIHIAGHHGLQRDDRPPVDLRPHAGQPDPAGPALRHGEHRLDLHRTGEHGRTRRFHALHGKVITTHIVMHNDQASAKRLDELTGGGYSATAQRIA